MPKLHSNVWEATITTSNHAGFLWARGKSRCWKNLPLALPLTEFIVIFCSPLNFTLSNPCLSYLLGFLRMMKSLRSTTVFFELSLFYQHRLAKGQKPKERQELASSPEQAPDITSPLEPP